MQLVLALSIGALLVAGGAALALLIRRGDPRAALLAVTFALLAATEGAALVGLGPQTLGLDWTSVAVLLALVASLLCPLTVLALSRTLGERDRSEALHWSSMETIRALADLTALSSLDLDARLERLLAIGCEQFGLDVGIVGRVDGRRYEVRAIRAPQGFPVRRGAAFPLDVTWCRLAFASPRPVAESRIADSAWAAAQGHAAFPCASYLGSAVRCDGTLWGTLAFAGLAPRRERFGATEKDLLTLMARWLGAELERTAERTARPARRLAPGWQERQPGVGAAGRARSIDLNALVSRLERRLERATGAPIALALASDLKAARDLRIPLERVVLSLAAHAAKAAGSNAAVEVGTANLELPAVEPGRLPAVAPARYVTLVVRVAGEAADWDALSGAFDAPPPDGAPAADGTLPLPTLYRLLQRRGGDLSVEAERGRGVAFTVFLPPAKEPLPAIQEIGVTLPSS